MPSTEQINFKLLFESVPGLYLILAPDLTIVAVSDAYLHATMTLRNGIVGRKLFEVFPDNPEEDHPTGELNLRTSLRYVLQHKQPHTMAIQKYDIRDADGKFTERYWSPLNKPLLNADGELIYIIHRAEDVTEFVNSKKKESQNLEATRQLQALAGEREMELYKRAQEIQAINNDLLNEVTERKAAEEKASAAKILLQSTIENHKDLLIFSVDRNYKYLTFNSTFKSATFHAYGITIEEGMSLLDSITIEEDRIKAKQNCDRALSGEGHITLEEYGVAHRYYFETRYNPITNNTGTVIGVTVLSVNVTERRVAEEKIRSLNKDLEAFTYSVAHDLRAPLRIIDGYSGLLKDEYTTALDKEGLRLLDVIASNAQHMGQLIDDLLDFSRLGRLSINPQPVNMNKILNHIIDEELRMIQKDRVKLNINNLDSANCDSSLIRHVFSNLLSNAVKYSRNRETAVIEVGSTRKQNEVIYFIKDNGSGFDMQYADKLFGVFQRLHKMSEFEGTGVGLAIVERIISKHGGRVWAEAEVNKGATFYFSLPTSKEMEITINN